MNKYLDWDPNPGGLYKFLETRKILFITLANNEVLKGTIIDFNARDVAENAVKFICTLGRIHYIYKNYIVKIEYESPEERNNL